MRRATIASNVLVWVLGGLVAAASSLAGAQVSGKPGASTPPVQAQAGTPRPEPTPLPPASVLVAEPASPKAVPPARAVREILGKVARIDLNWFWFEGQPPKSRTMSATITGTIDIQTVLAAIGVDQRLVPGAAQRRCPDSVTLTFLDATGKARARLGLCSAEGLGPELDPLSAQGGKDRSAISLRNGGALQRLLAKYRPAK